MVNREGSGRRHSSTIDPTEPTDSNPSKVSSTRRSVVQDDDALTPEEEYLLRVFRRYRKDGSASPHSGEKQPDKHTASPKSEKDIRKASPLRHPPPLSNDTNSASKVMPKMMETTQQLADTTSRVKMILEQKRKASAISRVGISTSSSGAGALKKAKINKVFGAGSSATSAKLDPVKYPSTGLLLLGEFRSFEEGEHDGERVYNPMEPLIRELKNFGVADASTAKKQLNETLIMRLTVPAHSPSWGINLAPAEHEDFSHVLFHFNPRRKFVAMNDRRDNSWGQQEKFVVQRWPDLFSVSITLAIQIDKVGFRVAIDGKYCATFAHRGDIASYGDQLTLQIMTADDYGESLRIIIHEIWWGHKDTMPGLPDGRSERQSTQGRQSDQRKRGEADDTFTDVHIGNLPPMPTPEDQEAMRQRLMDLFHPYGATSVRVRERQYGFVRFEDHRGARKAMEELDGEEIDHRRIKLRKAH